MFKIVRDNYRFFVLFVLWVVIGIIPTLFFTQQEITLFINSYYSRFSDIFFEYYTYVGNGMFYTLFAVILLFVSFRYTLIAALAGASVSLVVQTMKQIVFPHELRPWAVMHDNPNLHLVKDFIPYDNNSFPSGHTTTAFCMFVLIALFVKNKKIAWVFFVLALLVAYSRIYLLQHFYLDTYVGSMIGTGLAVGYYYVLIPRNSKTNWLDGSLRRMKK